MNKYLIRIPYSYSQYGKLYGFVYAEDEEEAEDLAQDRCNLHDDDYNDGDSGDSETAMKRSNLKGQTYRKTKSLQTTLAQPGDIIYKMNKRN